MATLSIDRAALTKFGDSSLADVLKRQPGITVDGGRGRGTEIRMRGLGTGYTQILINGDPAPSGFTIDSILPESVERIDIVRSSSADTSTQGVAGTINIILRKQVPRSQKDFKVGLIEGAGSPTYALSARVSGGTPARSFSVGAAANAENRSLNAQIDEWGSTSGLPSLRRSTQSVGSARVQTLNLTPRVSWAFSESNTLGWDTLISQTRSVGGTDDVAVTSLGASQPYPINQVRFRTTNGVAQSKGSWSRGVGSYSKLEAKLGATWNHRASQTDFTGFDGSRTMVLTRQVRSDVRDLSTIFGGKFSSPVAETHSLAFGWDGDFGRREEGRDQLDIMPDPSSSSVLNEKYDAHVSRLAVYGQDEWQIHPRWAAYFGLRWEGLQTHTEGNVIEPVRSRFSVLSPMFQSVWKLADRRRDQVRLALNRTYKSPQIAELIPRRYIANNNSPTTPDTQGNPELRPEVAWGLDLAYEFYWASSNNFSASVYSRRIDDVILPDLAYVNGTWISVPRNNGQANIRGIELDAKVALQSIVADAAAVDFRFNLSKNWSSVDSVPGPNNRLNRQSPLSANVGVDFQASRVPLSLGGNFNYRAGGAARLSDIQEVRDPPKRFVDIYGVWKLSKTSQIRASAANLLRGDSETDVIYSDAEVSILQRTTVPSYVVFNVALEIKR